MTSFKNRKIQILSSLFLSLLSYGANLDGVISEYEKNSYTTRINEANLKTYDIKERVLKKGEWNEISINSQNSYENSREYDGISTDNTVTYGMFYYKNSYNFTNGEFTENKVGVTKVLNDYSKYGDNKYNLKINTIQKDIQKITNETTKNSEIRDLIDLYKDYKNKEKEMEQETFNLDDTKKDYAIQARKYEVGTAARYDFDLARTEYEKSQLKYANLERELKILREKFLIYNVVLEEKEKLEELEKTVLKNEDFFELRLSEAEKIKLNESLNEEKIKKETFDYKIPKVTADAGYSFESKSFTVGLGVTKTFKEYNDTIEDLENEKIKLKLEYEQKKNEILSNVGQEMLNYTTYQTNELIAKKTMDITKEDYEIYAKKYELGVDTYANYVEKRNIYNRAVIDYEIAKNELAAYTKKIKYYK